MQEIKKFINVGDKVNLQLMNGYDEHQYITRVESMNEDGTLDVLIPLSKNRFIFIKNDTILKVIASRQGAVYEFRAKIVNKLFGVVPLLRLIRVSEVNKIQRRNYYRLKTVESIKARKIINLKEKQYEGYFEASMIDISGGGIAFASAHELNISDILEVSLNLNSSLINVIGKVVRKDLKEDSSHNKFMYGVSFERITEIERNIIMRFIFEEQRKLAKKGLI